MIVPASIDAALARMVPALLGITHGDHALSSWQGGGPLTADALDRLVDGTGIRTRPMRQAREWGYQRLAASTTVRSEEHTSELQSLMRISYAVFCLKKKNKTKKNKNATEHT